MHNSRSDFGSPYAYKKKNHPTIKYYFPPVPEAQHYGAIYLY